MPQVWPDTVHAQDTYNASVKNQLTAIVCRLRSSRCPDQALVRGAPEQPFFGLCTRLQSWVCVSIQQFPLRIVFPPLSHRPSCFRVTPLMEDFSEYTWTNRVQWPSAYWSLRKWFLIQDCMYKCMSLTSCNWIHAWIDLRFFNWNGPWLANQLFIQKHEWIHEACALAPANCVSKEDLSPYLMLIWILGNGGLWGETKMFQQQSEFRSGMFEAVCSHGKRKHDMMYTNTFSTSSSTWRHCNFTRNKSLAPD